MINNSNFYLLIDFNATKRYSHHWNYLYRYKTFLENEKMQFEIWIPKNADNEILTTLGKQCSGVLRSNMYGYERKHNLFQWMVETSINFVLKNFVKKLPEYYSEKIKSILSLFYLYRPLKKVKQLSKNQLNIVLVFPTTDSLAIRFLSLCLSRNSAVIGASLRTIGVGSKDGFSINDTECKFAYLINNYPRCRVILGCETIPYMNLLIKSGISRSNVMWAPVPSDSRLIVSNTSNKVFTIGFLGTARPNKGFEAIPNLLDALNSRKLEFNAVVQEAVFPWPSYNEALNRLKCASYKVEIKPANLSDSQFQEVFNDIDLLALPYKVENYLMAGSGLLYTAADLHIPILAKKDVAFSWDISEYHLGFLYSSIQEFVNSVKACMKKTENFAFIKYNTERNKSFKKFIQI